MADLLSNVREYSVSELAHSLKRTVEEKYSYIKVRGEISGFKAANSGHLYFDLKDESGLINVVCWRGKANTLQVRPEEGLEVFCYGKVSSYPQRSNYQLVLDKLEVAGEGALMQLLEKRKKDMIAKGYFDANRKQLLPKFPKIIGVVTSITGAVIKDIIHRVNERYPCNIKIHPVVVQGKGAEIGIANAIQDFNNIDPNSGQRPDVIIVARGGGSIEDLWCFNEEAVVLAAVNSMIPLVSAVGHETDFTLIDFASDLRAPTPTAAAEIITPVKKDIALKLSELEINARRQINNKLERNRLNLRHYIAKLPNLGDVANNKGQRLDDISARLASSLKMAYQAKQAKLGAVSLNSNILFNSIRQKQDKLNSKFSLLGKDINAVLQRKNNQLSNNNKLVDSYNYKNVLKRGFTIIKSIDGKLIKSVDQLNTGSQYKAEFYDGNKDIEAK